jgi:hypothetical protein
MGEIVNDDHRVLLIHFCALLVTYTGNYMCNGAEALICKAFCTADQTGSQTKRSGA